ncbi:MAG: glycoside hydrolase family 20 zincin-like fold domain-containing protein [Christensenellales bacterium]|jgi:hypothetical protein
MTYHLMPQPAQAYYSEKSCRLALESFTASGPEKALEGLATALFELPAENGACPIALSLEASFDHEQYSLTVDEEGAKIAASGCAGLFYGLQTLGQMLRQAKEGVLRGVEIKDKPALAMRAILFDLRFQSFHMDYILEYVRKIASIKINCLHIDYSDRFPYHGKYECIRDRNAFTPQEIAQLTKCCRDHFIDIVPVVQSFGHMEYVLSHPNFTHLVENIEAGNSFRSQCCPLKEESLELSKELIAQIFEAHGGPKYLSIGGDETFYLGDCPDCKEYVQQHGKGFLYLKRINQLSEYVRSLGAMPISYTDMAFAHPQIIDSIDKNLILGDWDYDTGDGVYETFLNWQTKDSFHSSGLDSLDEPLRSIAKDHLLMPDGKHFHPFGYLKYLGEKGFTAIGHCATACVGPDDLWTPNYTFHIPNIKGYSAAAVKWGALGMVNCCWEAFLFETTWYGLYCGAECFWLGTLEDQPERRFANLFYGLDAPELVEAMYRLSKPYTMVEKRWPKVKIPGQGRVELPLEQIYKNEELLENIKSAMEVFTKYEKIVPRESFSLREWIFGGKIKLFWLEMAQVYDQSMKNPEDVLAMEEAIADLEDRALQLKRQSLALHSASMPVQWIIIRFNKAFAKLTELPGELRRRDYRMGKNRR